MNRHIATICVTVLFGLSLFASAAGFAAYCPMPECSECDIPAAVSAPAPMADGCCTAGMDHHEPVAPAPQGGCDCDLMVDGLDAFGGSAAGSVTTTYTPSWTAAIAVDVSHSLFAGVREVLTARPYLRLPATPPDHAGALHSQAVLFLV